VQLEGSGARGVGPKVIDSAAGDDCGDGGGGDDVASCVGSGVRSERVCLVQTVVRQG
jgi:hypothetical protein